MICRPVRCRGRNDLEAPAQRLQPAIGDVLAAIEATAECQIARMSGSGPTCFGLYRLTNAARAAGATIAARRPDWWVMVSELG